MTLKTIAKDEFSNGLAPYKDFFRISEFDWRVVFFAPVKSSLKTTHRTVGNRARNLSIRYERHFGMWPAVVRLASGGWFLSSFGEKTKIFETHAFDM